MSQILQLSIDFLKRRQISLYNLSQAKSKSLRRLVIFSQSLWILFKLSTDGPKTNNLLTLLAFYNSGMS